MRAKGMVEPVVNVIVVALVMFGLFRPAGPLGATIARWRTDHSSNEAVFANWSTLVEAPRIDTLTAPVMLVAFSDYECKICRAQYALLSRMANRSGYGGVAFRHHPLRGYLRSEAAAMAAICASWQGRFKEMNDELFTTDAWITDANWVREARQANVPDLAAFSACMSGDSAKLRLQKDIALGELLGVTGTPSYANRAEGLVRGSLADSVFLRLARISEP